MTIKDYFKKELEKKFLYTQVLNTKRFQEIINDEFNGAAIINDKNFITFNFEDEYKSILQELTQIPLKEAM